jgi:hypothetical protein
VRPEAGRTLAQLSLEPDGTGERRSRRQAQRDFT